MGNIMAKLPNTIISITTAGALLVAASAVAMGPPGIAVYALCVITYAYRLACQSLRRLTSFSSTPPFGNDRRQKRNRSAKRR
ncbi:uncharacterized protein C8Q71DRAFT_241600 [Rhodofomes roseus]|uniref:Uncharacterized protein n=1 Tax=Rhodofomes roseus TaxID=34475 RepID=A0ABQ8K6L8_9APHY|nr:uncharacterized protein C8Q71DRAFT_241600 [Rhodofomes roseus]KAH9832853.1 hypothetical protein C8Q71DRAFT_241600 [Rhodofomes roseus]